MGFKTALTVTFLGLLGLTSAQGRNKCSCVGDCASATDCACDPAGTECKITVMDPHGVSTWLTISGKDLLCQNHDGMISTCMTTTLKAGTITTGLDANDVWRFSILEGGEGTCTLDLQNETADCIGQAPASLAGWDFSCSSQQPGAVISTNADEGNICVWDGNRTKCNEYVACTIQSNEHEEIECEGLTCEGLSEDGGVIVMATDNTAVTRYSGTTFCENDCKCGSEREGCWSDKEGGLVTGGDVAGESCLVDAGCVSSCIAGQHPECFCSDITCETCKCVGDADLTTTTPVPGGSTTIPAPGGSTTIPAPGGSTTIAPGGSTTIPAPGSTTIPAPGGSTTTPAPGPTTSPPIPGAAMASTSLTSGLVAVVAAVAVGLIQ